MPEYRRAWRQFDETPKLEQDGPKAQHSGGAKAPLFASAGLITPLTADDIKESYERWQGEREKLRLSQVRFAERAGVWFRGVFRNPN